MAVTIEMVAIELGRSTPAPDSIDATQWATWIDRAERAIRLRADRLGVAFESLDAEAVDDVILYAVVRRATRPVDGAESVTESVTVDAGTVNDTRRYPAGGQGDLFSLTRGGHCLDSCHAQGAPGRSGWAFQGGGPHDRACDAPGGCRASTPIRTHAATFPV